jgi:hypothetical protein
MAGKLLDLSGSASGVASGFLRLGQFGVAVAQNDLVAFDDTRPQPQLV